MPSVLHVDPAILASIRDFDWMIRSLALGEYHGKKVSKKLGVGMEFSQYRPYSQGDDLRQLDWKMFARSDKFYIKQSDVETNVSVTLVIDNSRSMLYEEQNWVKHDIAKVLAAVLSFVAIQNGDWVSIAGSRSTQPGNTSRHWMRILSYLQNLCVEDGFAAPFIENKRSKELFVVISDLYETSGEWLDFIQTLKTGRNDVIVFHLMGELEETLEFGNAVKFRDLESQSVLQVNTDNYQAVYQDRIDLWKKEMKHSFLSKGIDYHSVNFRKPIEDIVNTFLSKRRQLF